MSPSLRMPSLRMLSPNKGIRLAALFSPARACKNFAGVRAQRRPGNYPICFTTPQRVAGRGDLHRLLKVPPAPKWRILFRPLFGPIRD